LTLHPRKSHGNVLTGRGRGEMILLVEDGAVLLLMGKTIPV
jgi:hypothetical protein